MNNLIKKAAMILSKEQGISKNELAYIGYTDCSFMREDGKLLQFNIVCPGHECNNSTIAIRSWKI